MKRALPYLRRAAGIFPLSFSGVILISVLGCGLYYLGVLRADRLITLACIALLAAACLTLLTVIATAVALNRKWRKLDFGALPNLQTRAPCWTGLVLSMWRLPLVEVRWEWIDPPGTETELKWGTEGWVEVVTPKRRALLDKVRRRIEVRDVLGIAKIWWEDRRPQAVRILPEAGRLEVETLVQSLFSGDDFSDPRGEPHGDRVDMRRYAPGDPPRLILWKVYARTRKLMVRVPERAVVTQPRTCAYLVAGPADELGANMVRSVLSRNLLGQGWRFGADGSAEAAEEIEAALEILARSGNPGVESASGLAHFLENAKKDGYRSCMVVLPPCRGAYLNQIAHALNTSPIELTLVCPASKPSSKVQAEKWEKYVFYDDHPGEVSPTEVYQTLKRRDSRCLVYEAWAGRVYPEYEYAKH